jgi:hypothetical protein
MKERKSKRNRKKEVRTTLAGLTLVRRAQKTTQVRTAIRATLV